MLKNNYVKHSSLSSEEIKKQHTFSKRDFLDVIFKNRISNEDIGILFTKLKSDFNNEKLNEDESKMNFKNIARTFENIILGENETFSTSMNLVKSLNLKRDLKTSYDMHIKVEALLEAGTFKQKPKSTMMDERIENTKEMAKQQIGDAGLIFKNVNKLAQSENLKGHNKRIIKEETNYYFDEVLDTNELISIGIDYIENKSFVKEDEHIKKELG